MGDSDGCLYTEPHNQWKDHEGELSCMDICGGYIATGGDDGKILLRKIDKVNKVTNEIFAHPSGIHNISISTSGKYLLSCGNDGSVLMWNIHNKDLVKPRHRHSILSINAIHDMPEIHLDHGCKDYLSEYADKKNSHKTKKAKEIRDQILSDIQQLSKDFQELVAENEKLEESERLQSKDFITNQDDDAAFIKTVKQKVLKTKTGTERKNLINQLLCRNIEKQFWSQNEITDYPFSVKGFQNKKEINFYLTEDNSDTKYNRLAFLDKINKLEKKRLSKKMDEKQYMEISYQSILNGERSYITLKDKSIDEIYDPTN